MLSSVLNYRSERQKLITANVTNLDTEGYQLQELTFKNRLLDAMAKDQSVPVVRTHEQHLPMPGPSGNEYKVKESGERENQLMYNTTVDILARKFRSISTFLRDIK
jgi:flagellar basal-body rod protein FlgB